MSLRLLYLIFLQLVSLLLLLGRSSASKLVQPFRRDLVPFLWWVGRWYVSPVARMRPTSWRAAELRFFEPGARPGPGREGCGARAGEGVLARRFGNPRRTRVGVSLLGGTGFSQGRRRSVVSGRVSRSWVCATMISQVQRSAAAGSRSLGVVQPRVCLNSRKVCSMSNRRRNACQQRSISTWDASTRDGHSHTGFASPSLGQCSTVRRMTVPSMIGKGPACSVQAARRVSRGCSRSHSWTVAVP